MKIPSYLFFGIERGAVFLLIFLIVNFMVLFSMAVFVCIIVVLLQKDIELMCSIFLRRWMIVSGIITLTNFDFHVDPYHD